MKNNKIFLICIIALLVTSLIIADTYALFETNGEASKNLSIGSWNILVNNVNVSQSRTITLNDFVYTNGVHTQSNYFAPGSSAYFDLVIDATGTQVSVAYELTIDNTALADYPNIYFSIIDLATNQPVNASTYSGLIPVNSVDKTRTLRINLIWGNDPDYDDSDTSLIDGNLEFTLDLDFAQYIGE